MSLRRNNVGTNEQNGIDPQVGMDFLDPDRTMMVLKLQEDAPMDPDEIVIDGPATYSIGNMFKALKPSVDVSLSTGDETNPLEETTISFTSIKSFEPDDMMENIPLLRGIKDQQDLITRVEALMQEAIFQKMMQDGKKKAVLLDFLRSVIADIEEAEEEE